MRKTFTMSAAQHAKLLEAMQPVPAMWIGGPPRSVQQNANDAWCALGREMGFDGMTVRGIPGGSEYEFSAEVAPITQPAPRPAADVEFESWIAALGVLASSATERSNYWRCDEATAGGERCEQQCRACRQPDAGAPAYQPEDEDGVGGGGSWLSGATGT